MTAIRYVMTCVLCARKGDALPSKHPEGWRMVPNTYDRSDPRAEVPLCDRCDRYFAMRAGQG